MIAFREHIRADNQKEAGTEMNLTLDLGQCKWMIDRDTTNQYRPMHRCKRDATVKVREFGDIVETPYCERHAALSVKHNDGVRVAN